MVKEDYTATMGIMEIRTDGQLRDEVKSAGLEVLGQLSFSLKQGSEPAAELLRGPQVSQLRRRDFCSYEYSTDGGVTVIRVVVFDTGKRFYELTMVPNAKNIPTAMEPIFNAQDAILHTMEW